MNRISEHISYAEAVKSQTATRKNIDNTPNEEQLLNMMFVANDCFEPLRNAYGKPIFISSFFRSADLNIAIGGSDTSQHVQGLAIDIDADIFDNGWTNADMFNWLKDNVTFDQLIWEYGTDDNPSWVHISKKRSGNRNQILKATKKGFEFYK